MQFICDVLHAFKKFYIAECGVYLKKRRNRRRDRLAAGKFFTKLFLNIPTH